MWIHSFSKKTHKRVKFPSYFKGKVSHLLMPNTDLKHWQIQTTKTSRNELWFSVLVRNLKTQQEMRQGFCFAFFFPSIVAYRKAEIVTFYCKIHNSKTWSACFCTPGTTPLAAGVPRGCSSAAARWECEPELSCWLRAFQLLLFGKNAKNILPLCQLHLASSAAMVTTWGFSFIGFYCFLTLSWICSLSLLKCLIMLSGFLSSNRGNSCLESFGEVILSHFSCWFFSCINFSAPPSHPESLMAKSQRKASGPKT